MKTTFEKAAFAALLKKAKGNRTQAQFATEIQISKEHLSRMMNQKYDTAPSLETILRISQQTTEVSYQELMQAAGYDGKGTGNKSYPAPAVKNADSKLLTATILASLPQLNVAWAVGKSTISNNCDLFIQLSDCPLKAWYFLCMNNVVEHIIRDQFESNYLKLIFEELEPDAKYSFVTASASEYEKYISYIPRNLAVNLSVILVNTNTIQIVSETLLKTNGAVTDDTLNLCSF